MGKYFDWSDEKNEKLKRERGISFEEMQEAIESEGELDIVNNPNKIKYPNQKMYVVKYKDYIYLVPFVEDEVKIFFKTIIPNRKATKKYLHGNV